MKKFNKKVLNVMTTAALLSSVVAPMAAFAATDSRLSEIPTYSDDQDAAKLATLTFQEDTDFVDELQNGTVTLTFPVGAKVKGISVTGATYQIVGDYTVNLTVNAATAGRDKVEITPTVNLDGFSGSTVDVDVQSYGAGIPSGKYTLARIAQGDTITTALDKVTIGEDGGDLGAIRIEESSVKTIEAGDEITLKLPKGIEWDKAATKAKIAVLGGMASNLELDDIVAGTDSRTLKFKVKQKAGGDTTTRGYIQVTPVVTVDEDQAKVGDIVVEVSGDNVSSESVTVGAYSDYDVIVEADGTIPTIFTGRYDATDLKRDEQELAELNIKEGVKDSITPGRKTTVKFPTGVKIIGVDVEDAKGIDKDALQTALNAAITANNADEADDQRQVEFEIKSNSTTEKIDFNLKFYVSVKTDKVGDIEAELSGRQGVEGKVVLAKAEAPVTLTAATSPKIVIGKKDQALGEILIKESAKSSIIEKDKDNKQAVLKLVLPDDVSWNNEGTIEVVEGDLELETKDIDTEDDGNGTDNVLLIPIKGESTKPSTIKISGATIDVDRTVPEGAIVAKLKGTAVVENNDKDDDTAGKFDAGTAAKVEVANIATPAPGTVYANATFTIDSANYTVNGVEKTADVAPFIQDGRTFLPVRFVAEALGVTESNIIWNANTKTVTLIKGDRIAQIQLGSSNLVVNGVAVPMDTVAFVKDGRTVLPLRYAAQALGAEVNWDEATRTVNIK